MATSLTISKQIFLPNLNSGLTYALDTYAAFGYTVTEVYGIQTSSGTVTAALQISGTNITGLGSISVSSTTQNVVATAANTVAVGNTLSLVFSSNSAAQNIQFTLVATRTAVSSVSNSDGTLTISPTAGDVVASLASAPTITGKMTAASFAPSTTSGIIGTTTNDNAATGSVGEYVEASCGSAGATVTISIASPCVVTWSGHPFYVDSLNHNTASPIVFSTTGALPTGLTAGTTYWVIGSSITATTFKVATSIANAIAGTAINTSGSQSGTQTATPNIPVSTSTIANILAISLSAGDWDVSGVIGFSPNTTTLATQYLGWISTTSATFPSPTTGGGIFATQFTSSDYPAGSGQIMPTGVTRVSIASTSTVYLQADAIFTTSTMTVYGLIRARRMR